MQTIKLSTKTLISSFMRSLLHFITFLFALQLFAQQADTSLTVSFEGIKKAKGTKIYVALYDNEEEFLTKPIQGTTSEVKNGKAVTTFTGLKPGEYAISAFYDKNANGKMDTNFLGIPKEPTAMSNNAKARFGPPKYKDAKFNIKEDTTIIINF